ncbi:NAD-binding protein [Mycobacterium vicinigordonae]|uniref:NAD-binding protein n=1 Tax=Mycobacterium vicinigordonae TaxID=1719132 RepID=A0A7D6I2G7_9MYCO|nr:NAD-binding protein [Mycobacterium vicinigordonae]QLL05358.1 NAD-binding protein [Mycobacterium vicinigordonae]
MPQSVRRQRGTRLAGTATALRRPALGGAGLLPRHRGQGARRISRPAAEAFRGDDDTNTVIVSGTGGLAAAITEGLNSAGARVVRLVDDEADDTPDDLAEAGVSNATAVVCAGDDDAVNLEVALLAREANPDIRVVTRVANDVLREALTDDDEPGAIFDVAELASASIVEACLARTTHAVTAAGIEFVVSGAEASRETTLRELYGDLAPVAVIRGENSPSPGKEVVCPGRDLRVHAGDWVVMIGTADEVAARGVKIPRPTTTRSRRPLIHRLVDGARALRSDVNPAFYPIMTALLILVIGSTALLHFTFQASPPMSWIDALYFTAETITTTGFGDFSFLHQHTWLRLFGVMMMLGGVINTALLVSFIADVLLSRRFVYSAGRPRVRHLRNHIIVIGLSALGTRVVSDLTADGYDVAVIERDVDNRFLPSVIDLDVPVIYGDATLRQTLQSAHIDRARAVAVMTRDEVVNIETGIVAAKMLGRRLSPATIRPAVPLVLRVYDRALGRAIAKRFGFINVRSTVELAVPWFISAAIGLEVLGTFSIGQSSFVVGAMHVVAGSELDGMRMVDLSTRTRVIAITRPNTPVQLHPRRDARLCGDDTVYLIGPYRELLETLRKGQFVQNPDTDAGGHRRIRRGQRWSTQAAQ